MGLVQGQGLRGAGAGSGFTWGTHARTNARTHAAPPAGPLLYPHEMQTAEDAVRLQLNALKDNHNPRYNHGVQVGCGAGGGGAWPRS